jgi:hypothetical protein
MAEPFHTLLLVPSQGDPYDLFSDGHGGSKPPIFYRWSKHEGVWSEWGPHICIPLYTQVRIERALVLVWKGKIAFEGCDRASRRLASTITEQGSIEVNFWPETVEEVNELAQICSRVLGCERVVIHG